MSRSLSQTLIRSSISLSPSSTTNGSRFVNFRHRSNSPENFNFSGEIPAEESENSAVKDLEDVIHTMIVKKAQPNWIPFVPGASYWVPPKSKAQGYARVIGKLVKNKNPFYNFNRHNNNNNNNGSSLIKGNYYYKNNNHSWPSSAHFFKGASHSPLEGDISKHTAQSEDEEG